MNRLLNIQIFKDNADEIFWGNKTFEITENTKNFQEGDTVIFTVFEHPEHPINLFAYEVTCVVNGFCAEGCGLKSDYVALGLKQEP